MVSSGAKARANGQMWIVMGAESLCGPLTGRPLLYRREIQLALHNNNWSLAALQVLGGSLLRDPLQLVGFQMTFIFWLLCRFLLVWRWDLEASIEGMSLVNSFP